MYDTELSGLSVATKTKLQEKQNHTQLPQQFLLCFTSLSLHNRHCSCLYCTRHLVFFTFCFRSGGALDSGQSFPRLDLTAVRLLSDGLDGYCGSVHPLFYLHLPPVGQLMRSPHVMQNNLKRTPFFVLFHQPLRGNSWRLSFFNVLRYVLPLKSTGLSEEAPTERRRQLSSNPAVQFAGMRGSSFSEDSFCHLGIASYLLCRIPLQVIQLFNCLVAEVDVLFCSAHLTPPDCVPWRQGLHSSTLLHEDRET